MEIRDFKKNIFTGEVSFYIDDYINCHKCPILKAGQQNEFLIQSDTQKARSFIANEKIPMLINLNTERNLPHIRKIKSKSGNKRKKNRKC